MFHDMRRSVFGLMAGVVWIEGGEVEGIQDLPL